MMAYQREFDRRVRAAVVGVGSHCYRNLLPAMTYLPVELVAMCDLDEARLAATAAQYGVARTYARTADLYEAGDFEAVFLCVSPQKHPELAAEALAAGVHVWMEKPPAMRAAQIARLMERQGDRVVLVGFKKAFMPAIAKARELLGRDEHQPLRTVLAEYPMTIPADGRGVLERGEATNWLANGCHPLSAMIALGGPVRSVVTHRGAHGGGAVILAFEGGAVGNLHLGQGAPEAYERYACYGNHCIVTIDNGLRVTYRRGIPFDYSRQRTFAPEGLDHGAIVWEPQNCLATLENKALFTQGFWGELHEFCDSILSARPPATCGLDFALHLMQTYEAALLSDGEAVEVLP